MAGSRPMDILIGLVISDGDPVSSVILMSKTFVVAMKPGVKGGMSTGVTGT